MRTVVYQSYRTSDVPPWIARCLRTVKDWALSRGFDYAFIDDQMFEYAPLWYRDRVGGHILPIADLARLELAREFLAEGFERTVWVDADVFVFRPQLFTMEVTEGYAFCQEVWLEQTGENQATCSRRVNNAVTVFTARDGMVDFFIHAAKSVVRYKPGPIQPWDVSTMFLTALHPHVYFPLIRCVGLFSVPVLRDVARGGGPFLEIYRRQFGHPVAAANLCSSLRNKRWGDLVADDAFYSQVVDRLLQTQGEVVNRYAAGGDPAGAPPNPP